MIADGWEAAVEAALGSVLSAVVVDSPRSAREALETFAQGPGTGSVLQLGAPMDPRCRAQTQFSTIVSATRPDAQGVLQRLLADVDVVTGDWRLALDRSLAEPDRVFVTRNGDRVGGDIWQLGAGGLGATQAALNEAQALLRSATDERDRLDASLVRLS